MSLCQDVAIGCYEGVLNSKDMMKITMLIAIKTMMLRISASQSLNKWTNGEAQILLHLVHKNKLLLVKSVKNQSLNTILFTFHTPSSVGEARPATKTNHQGSEDGTLSTPISSLVWGEKDNQWNNMKWVTALCFSMEPLL